MYVVKPRLHHFLWLVLLGPLVVFEGPVLVELLHQTALGRGITEVASVLGEVTETGHGSRGEPQLRYRFHVEADGPWYSASDMTGRRNLWTPVTPAGWNEARQTGRVSLRYLRRDPWANAPVERAGSPLVDISVALCMLIGLDAFAVYELHVVRANRRRCRLAAAENRARKVRYWESRWSA
jgi:hypothetical protein